MRFHHAMIRVKDLEKTLHFWCDNLGFEKIAHKDMDEGRYSFIFIKHESCDLEIELIYNWDRLEGYEEGSNFGHFAFFVENIYDFCTKLKEQRVFINRPPVDGIRALLKDPNGIVIELLQEGDPLPIKEPWASMEKEEIW